MKIFLITILMLAFVFIGIGIKIILKKDGEFAGTCASQSPFLNQEGETCGFCGKTADEMCPNES
ncbi:MAG: membrane or secreted protein [Flavobacteriales bacterium]